MRTATFYDDNIGLSDELLENTDVLIWWGHVRHKDVPDEWADKIVKRINEGMGFIALHSTHYSKIFKSLMGTQCNLQWRISHDHERLWNIAPNHPVMKGIPEYFELDREETYGERFDIPAPDEVLMLGWYSGGEVGRSGNAWYRGNGRIFYFQPGHETFDSLNNEYVRIVIRNAARWCANR